MRTIVQLIGILLFKWDANFVHWRGISRLEKYLLWNLRFMPRMPWSGYFSDFFQRIAQIGTQASTGVFRCGGYTWVRKSWKVYGIVKSLSPSLLAAWLKYPPFFIFCNLCLLTIIIFNFENIWFIWQTRYWQYRRLCAIIYEDRM